MKMRIAQCASAIGLALAAMSPLQADTYQFIKSGDPVAAATADSSSMASIFEKVKSPSFLECMSSIRLQTSPEFVWTV